MSSTKTVKLFTAAGEPLEDAALSEDFLTGRQVRPLSGGRARVLLPQRLRRLCLPYGSFGHVFKRAMLCASRTCGKVVHTDTFWLVFCQGADELAEAKTIDEKHADRALSLLRERLPDISVGL